MRKISLILKSLIILSIVAILGYVIHGLLNPTLPPKIKDFAHRNVPDSPHRQSADIPRVIEESNFDPRFILLRATERFLIPSITSASSPLGSQEAALTYDAQTFQENNPERGGLHSGHDLNGIGGENTDEGDPIYALADGLVLYRGCPSPGWGNVIILGHRLPNGQLIQSLYAHLEKPRVIPGQLVGKNRILGHVGTAGGHYLAHLHLELIRSTALEAGLPAYGQTTMNRLSLNEIMTQSKLSSGFFIPYNLFSHLEVLKLSKQRSHIQFKALSETPQP